MTLTKPRPAKLESEPFNRSRVGKSNLRDDIVGGAFAMTFSLLVIAFSFTFMWQRSVFQDLAIDRVEGLVASQEQRVESFVDDGLEDAELLATRDGMIDRLAAAPDISSEDQASIQGIVDRVADVSHDVSWMRVFTADLDLVATAGDGAIDVGDAYLADALTGPVVGRVVLSTTGERVHLVAAPIVSGDDVVGVAVIGQSTSDLDALTGDYTGLGATGETILAQPWPGEGARFIAPIRFDEDAALHRTVDGSQSEVPVVAAMSAGGHTSTSSIDYRGVEVLSASRILEQTGWAIVVKIDRSEAMAPLTDFLRFGLLTLLVGSALAGLFAWLIARQIRKPILVMKNAATAVAGGDRHVIIPNGRVDEIGDLADAFNAMTHELNELTGSLEVQVADRTAELRIRNDELRAAMAAKETFLASVSHEVRGPLTAMMGFLDLVNADAVITEEERPKLLEMAVQQADEVLILIEDLLAAARVESGTLKVAEVRVDLEAQVRQVMEGLSASSGDAIEVATTPVLGLGDPSRARQIIRNLVTNAIRYGGPSIRITSEHVGQRVAVIVSDDGDGIPPEERASIFDAYTQAKGRREVEASVGIGLHVSRQLAELMGGTLTYDHIDGWSSFRLEMPGYTGD